MLRPILRPVSLVEYRSLVIRNRPNWRMYGALNRRDGNLVQMDKDDKRGGWMYFGVDWVNDPKMDAEMAEYIRQHLMPNT